MLSILFFFLHVYINSMLLPFRRSAHVKSPTIASAPVLSRLLCIVVTIKLPNILNPSFALHRAVQERWRECSSSLSPETLLTNPPDDFDTSPSHHRPCSCRYTTDGLCTSAPQALGDSTSDVNSVTMQPIQLDLSRAKTNATACRRKKQVLQKTGPRSYMSNAVTCPSMTTPSPMGSSCSPLPSRNLSS